MCDQSVVVFSSGANGKQVDGMPVLNILLNDLKSILHKEKKADSLLKIELDEKDKKK